MIRTTCGKVRNHASPAAETNTCSTVRAADGFCFMQRILLLVQTADVADTGKRFESVVCALRRIQGPSASRVVICVECRQR